MERWISFITFIPPRPSSVFFKDDLADLLQNLKGVPAGFTSADT